MEDRQLEELERDPRPCDLCHGTGYRVTCPDDMCYGQAQCIHGDGVSICPDCKGEGEI